MSLTTDRTCGTPSAAWEQANTSELPGINWKPKNPTIIPNRWQANPYTVMVIKQVTSFSIFFVTKLGQARWKGRNGRKQIGFLNWEIIVPIQSLQADTASHLLCSLLHSASDAIFSSVQSKEMCGPDPLGTFNTVLLFFKHQCAVDHTAKSFDSYNRPSSLNMWL